MREMLFKGKRIDNGEWVFGDLIHEPYRIVIQYYEDEIKGKGNCAKTGSKKRIKVTVDPETVCQHTEVDDKNGKNIFHKDIVSAPFTGYGGKKCTRIGVVEYLKGAFCVNWNDSEEYGKNFLGYVNGIEVIGNVFDNPELIGGGD